ncbi:MAG: 2-amino-4-hydroxy-6-hydroxymethyldihydropteridine diphosphokinase [Polyangiales bacterium]
MRVVVGLGSNLGSRFALINAAMNELQARFGENGETRRSPFVRTPAMTWEDAPPGPDYLNAAMSFECTLPMPELLEVTQSLERLFRRKKTERWGNRTLDIDILWAPLSCDEPRVPHPGLLERDFALGPAMEVDDALRGEYRTRLLELGGMPTIVLPPLVERTGDRVVVRRALDSSDALAVAWGTTGQDFTKHDSAKHESTKHGDALTRAAWVEAPPTSPLGAAGACVDTAEAHLVRPASGRWELESLEDHSCVLRALP